MTALAVAAALLPILAAADQDRVTRALELKNPEGGESRLLLMLPDRRVEPPKRSPLHPWDFEWLVGGLAYRPATDDKRLRFRVFSQMRRAENDEAPRVARLLMRLFDFNDRFLGFDHSLAYNNQIIDVYLCFGGKAGAEQRFTDDVNSGRATKANTIHVYDVRSFTDPLEMAREVAHEYGHATLPAHGPFKGPEEWPNGDLGERLYLRWLLQEISANRLQPDDAFGVSLEGLKAYVAEHVTPLARKAAVEGPAVSNREAAGFDAYLGLALHCDQILPKPVFARALVLAPPEPEGFPAAVAEAVAERDEVGLRLAGRDPVWVPLGSCRLVGGQVVSRKGAWAKVKPTADAVRIRKK